MLYLLWGLLNIGLFLVFVVICFKATILVREKLGFFSALVLACGLLSFMTNSNDESDNKAPGSDQNQTWTFISDDTLNNHDRDVLHVNLEETLISDYKLSISYGTDRKDQKNIPISASSFVTGITSGTKWTPVSVAVKRTNSNDQFQYFIYGIVKWKLLGSTIYSQKKEYTGFAKIK